MRKGLKDFLMRGSVVDLAVAVVIGAAFTKVVGGFAQGVINPLIAAVAGKANLDSVGQFTVHKASFSIGPGADPPGQLRVRRRGHLLAGGHAPEQAGHASCQTRRAHDGGPQ